MKMHMIGDAAKDKVLLIHPMSASHEVMKLWFAGLTEENEYCLLLPDLSAHGEDRDPYISAPNDAEAIKNWLIRHDFQKIRLGYGASLGAITLFRLMDDADLHFDRMWLEGMSFYERSPLMARMVYGMTVREQKKYRNNPELAEKELNALYGEDTGRIMAASYPYISEKDTRSMVKACFSVQLPELPEEAQERVTFSFGSKDAQYGRAKKLLQKKYPASRVRIWDGYRHCEYPAIRSLEFLKELCISINA